MHGPTNVKSVQHGSTIGHPKPHTSYCTTAVTETQRTCEYVRWDRYYRHLLYRVLKWRMYHYCVGKPFV